MDQKQPPPRITLEEARETRLIKDLPFYPHKAFDPIFIRNFAIRIGYLVLNKLERYGFKIPYNIKIQLLQDWFHSSPQNIERIITDNTNK